VLRWVVSLRLRVPRPALRKGGPRKGICLFVAFVMLFGPESFQQVAQGEMQYANLSTASWANGNTTITYTYDDNGSVTSKTTTGASAETVVYEYNLQNRLETITRTYNDGVNDITEVTTYTYNDNGIRVGSHFTKTEDSTTTIDETKTFLIDSYNHTGYAQVLEETRGTGPGSQVTTFTIGDDVIAQTVDGVTDYLLYDGHGSTRQLAEWTGSDVTITDSFSYDAYGVLLQDDSVASADPGKVAQQSTNLLYTGEQFDVDAQMYNLRARYYDPLNGRFNRVDPFAGNNQDPQSLHKYLYCLANPVNGIDPTGEYSLSENLTTMSIIGTVLSIVNPAIIGIGTIAKLSNVEGPSDAYVISFSYSYLAKAFYLGMGAGFEITYELLYIKALKRFQDYYSIGASSGLAGGTGTIEVGPVWNVKEVIDYEKLFFSSTFGAAPWMKRLIPSLGLTMVGGAVTGFWTFEAGGACGFKFGPASASSKAIYSGTMSWYWSGGPFSWCRNLVQWFNKNITPPELDTVEAGREFIRQIKEKLTNPPLPTI